MNSYYLCQYICINSIVQFLGPYRFTFDKDNAFVGRSSQTGMMFSAMTSYYGKIHAHVLHMTLEKMGLSREFNRQCQSVLLQQQQTVMIFDCY